LTLDKTAHNSHKPPVGEFSATQASDIRQIFDFLLVLLDFKWMFGLLENRLRAASQGFESLTLWNWIHIRTPYFLTVGFPWW